MSKKLIITESEKNNIKQLYNINEISLDDIFNKPPENFTDLLQAYKYGNNANVSKPSNDSKPEDSKTETETDNDSYLNDKSSGSVDSKWMKVTKKVIDKFEGGYWNGANTSNSKTSKLGICSNHPHGSMQSSTETMFGLDRYNGSIEKTSDGQEFFNIIDKEKKDLGMAKFCKKWVWGYKGGELEDKLKTLAAKIMKHSYDRNANNYFSPELKKRVESNDRLLMHFSYASWNGPGFFQKFAKSLNNAVKDGKSDKELLKQAIDDRKNTRLVRQDKVAAVLTDPNLNLA
jgi:hypothetical protein